MQKRGQDVKGTGMHSTNIYKENPDKEYPKDIYYMCSHFRLKKRNGDKFNCDYEKHNCNFTRGAAAYKCQMYQEETNKKLKEDRINYGKRKEKDRKTNKHLDYGNQDHENNIVITTIPLSLIKKSELIKCKFVITDEEKDNRFVVVLLSIKLKAAIGEKETKICYDLKKAFFSKNINVRFNYTKQFKVPTKDAFGNHIMKQDIPSNFSGEAWCFYTKSECNLTVINKAISIFIDIIYQGIEDKKYIVSGFYV